MMTAETFENLTSRLLEGLTASLPVDVVLLTLHGSMMAENCFDVEGAVLEKARAIVGHSTVIAVLIDPHAHLSRDMLEYADLVAAFHEWPHTDVEERATHVFERALQVAAGHTRPTAGMYDCRMIAGFPTQRQPMRAFVDQLKRLEVSGEVISASFVHGFPWGDNPDVGAKMLVWTDADSADAERRAHELGSFLFAQRQSITLRADFELDEALTYLDQAPEGLIVLCDAADNVPGGGAGDSTFVLSRLLERGLGDVCLGPLWDPMATAVCFAAGEGAHLALRIGGKSGPNAGDPVDVEARIVKLMRGSDERQAGSRFGDRAWIEIGGSIDVVLHTCRATLTDPTVLTELGIDLKRRKGFVGKMLMHGGAAFAPMAAEVLSVATPGTLNLNYESVVLTRRSEPWWPKNSDPFGQKNPIKQ